MSNIEKQSIERRERKTVIFYIFLSNNPYHTISIITQLPLLFFSSCMSYIYIYDEERKIHWTSFLWTFPYHYSFFRLQTTSTTHSGVNISRKEVFPTLFYAKNNWNLFLNWETRVDGKLWNENESNCCLDMDRLRIFWNVKIKLNRLI